jgi:hypothetical protein
MLSVCTQVRSETDAWNHIDRDPCFGARWCIAAVESQPKLGIFPDRWTGTGAGYSPYPGAAWPSVTTQRAQTVTARALAQVYAGN